MAQQNSSELIVLGDKMEDFTPNSFTQPIWNFLMGFIGNEIGVAGLMGNLYQESHCYPNILNGDSAPPTSLSINYTTRVDNHAMSREEFVSRKAYGLAQWLSRSRKENLYDAPWGGGYPSSGNSIGSLTRGLNMIKYELQNGYTSTLSALTSATNIDDATDYVFTYYEGAGDGTLAQRQHFAQQIYDIYAGGAGTLHVYVTSVGNGYAYVSNPTPDFEEYFTLYCIPAQGETLINVVGYSIPSGYPVALNVLEEQEVRMPNESIQITVTFSGETPPVPPTPTARTMKITGMPIWMYPIFRKGL